jgi:hypothetical protein
MIGELADGALAAFERGERVFPLPGEAVGDRTGRSIFGELARTVERRRGRQHHPQYRRERAQVIIGSPLAQAPQRRGDRRHADHARERPQPAVRHFVGRQPVGFPRNAEQLPRPERCYDDRAGGGVDPVRHPVIERPERSIKGDDTGAIDAHAARNAANAASLRAGARALTRGGRTGRRRLEEGIRPIGSAYSTAGRL